jgi:diaminohydroxyphosphoribosylaminopyrimidine deaminase / 5-amino-6-(5-phosphoribosylamino)uracil reductase
MLPATRYPRQCMIPNDPGTVAAQDEFFMRRALELAQQTIALASPNPQVGCVIVRTDANDEIIGEGAHIYDNYDHAEIVALKQATARGLSTFGATAYVTLEPCSHHGRTGPCADALVAAGIARCVIATTDPNPLVSGQGVQKLRNAGIEVTVDVLQQQARELNDAFAHFIRTRTPFVTLKAALSADDKIAPPPASRFPNQPHWLTGPAARSQVQLIRHASDAILTGIGTVLADNPLLTDRTEESRRRPLLRVVLDTHLRIPRDSELVRSANRDLLILTSPATPSSRIKSLTSDGAEVGIIPDHAGRLSLPAVLNLLAERKIISLLLEAGSHLNGAFLRQNLVDKAIIFHSDAVLGEEALPFAHGADSASTIEECLLRPTVTTFGPDTCITGYLHDPWA